MASSKTNNTRRKTKTTSTSGRKTSSKSTASRRGKSQPNPVMQEVVLLLTIAFVILLFLSLLGVCGTAGSYISLPVFGLFGITGYIFPFLLAVAVFFLVANNCSGASKIKVLGIILTQISISALVQLIDQKHNISSVKLTELFTYGYTEHRGGGFAGGMLAKVFDLFGSGGIFLAVVFIIIGLVIVTERSFINGVKNSSTKVVEMTKENLESYRQETIEKQHKREEKRVAGVTNDTIIPKNKTKTKENELPEDVSDGSRTRDVFEIDSIDSADKSKHGRDRKHAEGNSTSHDSEHVHAETGNEQIRIETVELSPLYPEDTQEYRKKRTRKIPDDLEELRSEEEEAALTAVMNADRKDTQAESALDAHDVHHSYEENTLYDTMHDDTAYNKAHDDGYNSSHAEAHEEDDIFKYEPYEEEENEPFGHEAAGKALDDNGSHAKHEAEAEAAPAPEKTYSHKDNKGEMEDMQPLVIEDTAVEADKPYEYPPVTLLAQNTNKKKVNDRENNDTARKLKETLQSFGVNVTVTDVSCGPAVTRYELQPEQGVKVGKIVSLADDIKLNLAATDIRIEAPIPGKAAVGIEVPNKEAGSVFLRELIESDEFKKHPSAIAFGVGKDIAGKVIVADIAKMPHLLIAGATGSGKSVCINTIIMSIIYRARPDEVKLIMVDPKVVELSVYNGIPHLMIPVVTDPKKASQALNWAVAEMTDRYNKFAQLGVRDLKGYNAKISKLPADENGATPVTLPQIVIIIDELADLMMVAPGEVEDAICRLAQLARACGIHLVIATQRPSVNVITGLIKANVPSRIAFSVSSGVDSRTILDMNGAEKLLGKGDMLFYPSGYQKPVRVQGAFVSDKEVSDVVEFFTSKQQEEVVYDEKVVQAVNTPSMSESQAFGGERDAYFEEAGRFMIEKEKASIGLIQRYYKVGYQRAARIVDQLCDAGVVGPEMGTKPRKILMTMEEFEEFLKNNR